LARIGPEIFDPFGYLASPTLFCRAQLFQPKLLVRAIDFIADNEEEYAKYRKLQPVERRSLLRT
jgi:hypothetical protein